MGHFLPMIFNEKNTHFSHHGPPPILVQFRPKIYKNNKKIDYYKKYKNSAKNEKIDFNKKYKIQKILQKKIIR